MQRDKEVANGDGGLDGVVDRLLTLEEAVEHPEGDMSGHEREYAQVQRLNVLGVDLGDLLEGDLVDFGALAALRRLGGRRAEAHIELEDR